MGKESSSEKIPLSNKEKIIQAARELIQSKGVASASLSEIADSAGVAKGTLHYYYRSKADLLFELAEEQSLEFSRRFLELTKDTKQGEKRDTAIKRLLSEIVDQNKNSILIHLIMEGATGNAELKKKFRSLYHEWSSTIRQGLEQLISLPVSDDTADIILASLIGMLFNTAVEGNNINTEEFLEFILKGIGQGSK
ncbi:MAG: TetR/AcrR family transcriptional regulator [Fibrobacterota bacterium]